MTTPQLARAPKERPILFNGDMVRAILDGRKTQTRRVIKPQPEWREAVPGTMRSGGWSWFHLGTTLESWPREESFGEVLAKHCPYGKLGDRLWVKEVWGVSSVYDDVPPRLVDCGAKVAYRVNNPMGIKARSPYFMPRWASRIDLEVTGVSVERVQDIDAIDAEAEGIEYDPGGNGSDDPDHYYRLAFADLWDSIAKPEHSWEANPWVWVIEFKVASVKGRN